MKSPLQLPSTFGVHIEIHEIRAFSFCDSFSLVNITFPFVYPENFITIRISRQTQFFSLFAENGSATCLRLVKTLPSRDLLLRCQYNVDFNYDWARSRQSQKLCAEMCLRMACFNFHFTSRKGNYYFYSVVLRDGVRSWYVIIFYFISLISSC